MINENGEHMVEHHVKYKEIHGVDETTWMTKSEHSKLHIRLRRGGKCNIPADELSKISSRACMRTSKLHNYQKNYLKQNKTGRTRVLSMIPKKDIEKMDIEIEKGTFASRSHAVRFIVKQYFE